MSLLLALFVASPAAAAAPAIGTPEFDQLVRVASGHWPAAPCGGEVRYGYADLPGTAIGYASWMQPAVEAPDPATFSDCRIDIDAALEAEEATLCTVVAHELGHLLGHGHSAAAGDLMAASLRDPLPECAAAFPSAEPETAVVLTPESAPAPKVKRRRAGRSRAKPARRPTGPRRQGVRAGGRA